MGVGVCVGMSEGVGVGVGVGVGLGAAVGVLGMLKRGCGLNGGDVDWKN